MPKWVSKRDGALLKLPNALHNASAPQPGAPYEKLRVGHSRIIQKGEI